MKTTTIECTQCKKVVEPRLRTTGGAVNCEETALFCPECNKMLTEPEMDCR